MIVLKRTTSEDADFNYLTNLFDEYLVEIDGDEKDFFAQFNQIYIKNVVVCYENDIALGCGAFKEYEPNVAELKRMFVVPESRGKGIASKILSELECWAKEEGFTSCILETSFKLEKAIALYKSFDFEITPNYGQYIGVESSICMKKAL
ncbi:GNAT family N-acetyltransferase [Flavobacterium sp. LMO8]|jgi:GNAT superfamily N-acetyltransferase|uniref:GNAT family N-acetyltransferase n=1 Tax=Flavobacterium sp. LMO8 TaxID=2654244 RepID=UPI001291C671|nr:GNAT family N-acetyltransferase [Flavobacterium sp. LMO8]MQP24500.1 GNAT family N-acetyltransferase [Flavobacterium sp. LMO8]